jgi:hypothetical protein
MKQVVVNFAASLRAYLVTGLFGGAVVYLVSVVDRIATLWSSFNTPSEPPVFALYLAPIVLLGLAVGAGLGTALLVVRAVWLGATWLAARARLSPRLAPWIAGGVTVVALGLLLRAALASHPALFERPLFSLVKKIDGKLVSIDPVVANFSLLFLAAIFAVVAALLVADVVLGFRPERRAGAIRWLGAALFATAGAVRSLRAHRELVAVRQAADRLIVGSPTSRTTSTCTSRSSAGSSSPILHDRATSSRNRAPATGSSTRRGDLDTILRPRALRLSLA